MPLFHRGEHLAWAFSNLHVLDIGGMGVSGSAPAADSMYGEALRFGAIRIIRGGRIDDEWKRYLVENVRTPGPVLNDIRSMIAAGNVAQMKLDDVVGRFGVERHRAHNERNKRLTEELLRRRIAAMPDGRYEATEYIEFDAHGGDDLIEVRCSVTVQGSDLHIAFAGDPQVPVPVNGTRGTVYGSVMTHLLTMLGYGDLPFNAGMWRPVTVDLGPEGTVVNARRPAPVSMGHGEAAFRCGKAVRHALNQAVALSDDPALRARVGGIASDAFAGFALFGTDERGAPAVLIYQDTVSGTGGGAQTVADGQDLYGSCTMAGSGMTDVELHEASDPVVFLWRRIAANSGGPGQQRGGQGLDQAFVLLGDAAFGGFTTVGCAYVPPPGFGGGLPPATSEQYPVRGTYRDQALNEAPLPLDATALTGTAETIGLKVGDFVLHPGDVLHAVGGGGAGLGDPLLRAPELVAQDVADGYITAQHAEDSYGVIVDTDGGADPEGTRRRRDELRRERIGGARPEREPTAPEPPGSAVTRLDGAWTCAACGQLLAPAGKDWRRGSVTREHAITERFAALGMRVRGRAAPTVRLVEVCCPSCASALATDVRLDRAGSLTRNGGAGR
jgi:N-methylhydantoinase B